jgi:uncharacterized membrane protein YhaH (DUF805 family)
MTDQDPRERPRPQFGEYATPEEQRASIQVPQESAHADEPVPVPASRSTEEHARPAVGRFDPDSTSKPAASTGNSADRIATIALLAIGLFNVLTTVPGLLDLPSTLNAAFERMGLGTFTPTPAASAIGIGLAIFYGLAWLATLAISLRSLRAARLSFWIPLVAGVVVTIVAMICFLVLFFGDPAFMEYVSRNAG